MSELPPAPAPAVDEGVQAALHESLELSGPPRVDEVRMCAELAARRERELRPAEHGLAEARVAVDLRDRGHRDGVRRRAAPARA